MVAVNRKLDSEQFSHQLSQHKCQISGTAVICRFPNGCFDSSSPRFILIVKEK